MDYAKSTTASLLNSEPFKSYKPSPDVIWKSYVLYSLLGAGCAIPWYSVIASVDYFQYRYPNAHMIRILSITYLFAWLLLYALFSSFGRQYTSWTRVSAGLSVGVISLLVLPVMDAGFITGERGTDATYYVTIAVAAVAGAADAVAQGSLLGIAAELPNRYAQAIVVGSGASGVVVFVVRVITRAVVVHTDDSVRFSAVSFFTICALLIVIVLSAFVYVHRMPAMGYYNSIGLGSHDTVRMLLEDESSVTREISSAAAIATVAAGKPASMVELNFKPVVKEINLLVAALALVSIFTIAIFPGFLVDDVFLPGGVDGWNPLLVIGTFVILDLLGRSMTAFFVLGKHSILIGAAAARLVVLMPFFVLALVGPPSFRTRLPVFILTALLGLTHGYLAASLAMLVPRAFPSGEAEAAGTILTIISATGSVLGAALSWIWIVV